LILWYHCRLEKKICRHFAQKFRTISTCHAASAGWASWPITCGGLEPIRPAIVLRIDYALWERLNHNPLLFLRSVGRSEVNAAVQNPAYLEMYDRVFANLDAYLKRKETWCTDAYEGRCDQQWAYFSMEFGVHEICPSIRRPGRAGWRYLKEASDLGAPLVGVGLMYAEGYFSQRIPRRLAGDGLITCSV